MVRKSKNSSRTRWFILDCLDDQSLLSMESTMIMKQSFTKMTLAKLHRKYFSLSNFPSLFLSLYKLCIKFILSIIFWNRWTLGNEIQLFFVSCFSFFHFLPIHHFWIGFFRFFFNFFSVFVRCLLISIDFYFAFSCMVLWIFTLGTDGMENIKQNFHFDSWYYFAARKTSEPTLIHKNTRALPVLLLWILVCIIFSQKKIDTRTTIVSLSLTLCVC